MHKMIQNNFPPHITAWSISFLENRNQFVKIDNTVSSAIGLNAGCPQGTLSGPNNFKLFINDLTFSLPYIKYVDDTTVASISDDCVIRPYNKLLMIYVLGVQLIL